MTDKRRTKGGNIRHSLSEILFVVFASVLCGYQDWEMMELFAKEQIDWFRKYYAYKRGIPSHDTIERLMASINPKEFNDCLQQWLQSIQQHSKADKLIAIDGKRLKGSYDTGKGQSAIHLLTAYATEQGICMQQVKTQDKSNEIKAIPELLNLLSIEDCIVSIDAIGCQKNIAEQIIDKQADYILAVKRNQQELYDDIVMLFKHQEPQQTHIKDDKGHGREERRICSIMTNLSAIQQHTYNWKHLSTLIKIESTRYIKTTQKQEHAIRYYISSVQGKTAEQFNQLIRQHWAIENNLHWNLDVVFGEDKQRKRTKNMAQNMNLVLNSVMPFV